MTALNGILQLKIQDFEPNRWNRMKLIDSSNFFLSSKV